MVQSFSPQQPTDLVAEAPAATREQVAEAASLARSAQRDWWNGPAAARAQALSAAADAVAATTDELAELVVREVGKPLGEARGEVGRSVAILRYYA